MKYQHIRNATGLLELGEHRLLIDPMLSASGALPGLKLFGGGKRRNPLVELPQGTLEQMETATAVLVTHEHPDHLDSPGLAWLRARKLPVLCSPIDVASLARKGLDARAFVDGVLGMHAETVETRHGSGLLGWLMGPVTGFYLAADGEPSVYLTSDTVLTDPLTASLERLAPDVVIAPAGSANFGRFRDILFSVDELVTIAKRLQGHLIFNHLEAMDHCPTTRTALRERMRREGLDDRTWIPEDGEARAFQATSPTRVAVAQAAMREPGFQKWLTGKFAPS